MYCRSKFEKICSSDLQSKIQACYSTTAHLPKLLTSEAGEIKPGVYLSTVQDHLQS